MINIHILLKITKIYDHVQEKLYTLDIEFKIYDTMLRVNVWIHILMQNLSLKQIKSS